MTEAASFRSSGTAISRSIIEATFTISYTL